MARLMIDYNKCTGCEECETACSMNHYKNEVNPQKSRIRVYRDEDAQIFFPVIAGSTTEAECTLKYDVLMEGKKYDECTLCRTSCPSRPWFREPDTDIALKCDFCGDPPDPSCVKVCTAGALTLI